MSRLAALLVLVLAGRSAADDFPQAVLKTDHLKCVVYLPDAEKGYYRGTRFDWSGVLGHVEFAGHKLFTPWKAKHNPTNNDDILGPVEEFGMETPLGYADAKVGETFVKVGVGELVKPKEEKYRFYHNYKIAKAGKWTVKQVNPAKIEFRQELAANGYAYTYLKTVTTDPKKASIIMGHSLTNTGTKPIVTDVYNHNFFNVDADPIGPNYALDFAFPLKADGKERFAEVVKLTDNEWRFTKPVTTGSFHAVLKDLPKEQPGQPFVTLRHGPSKLSVAINGSQAPARFNVWGMATTVCPEPFIELAVKPGETVRWAWFYEFTKD